VARRVEMSGDPEPAEADILDIEARQDSTGTTIVVAGELDMFGTERFWAFISEALAPSPRALTVDPSGLEFVDSAGLMALVRARDAAVEAGVAFRVRNPSRPLRHVAELCGLGDLLSPT
jgi:anti-sigma B factor antagonist